MLKLREDLLAGRDEQVTSVATLSDGGAPTTVTDVSSPAPAPSLGVVQVTSAVTKSAAEENAKDGQQIASAKGGQATAAESGFRHPVVALVGLASHTVSWFGSTLASGLDFICDGRCRDLGVQGQRTTSLIIN
jgi:hypothetical protein